MERPRQGEQGERLGESSLRFTVDNSITPYELAMLSKKLPDGAFVRTPHVGGQHGNQMAVLLPEFSDIEIHALDMNTLHKDTDFLPACEINPTEAGKPNNLLPLVTIGTEDRFVANTTIERSIKVGKTSFSSGAPLSDVHMASVRAVAANPRRIRTFTEVYQDNEIIYQTIASTLSDLKFIPLIRRAMGADGRYAILSNEQKQPIIEKYGFHRIDDQTNPNIGVVMPLEASLVLDGLIRAHQTGQSHIWHIAGTDMIEYVQNRRMQQTLNALYGATYSRLPKKISKHTPPHVNMTIIPGSGLRFFGDKKQIPVLEKTFEAYVEYQISQQSLDQATKDRNRQIGIAIQQLFASNAGYVPELPKRKQEIANAMPRTAVENARGLIAANKKSLASLVSEYPEPYLPANAQNCITQWHVLGGKVKKLAFAPSYMDMSLGNLSYMQAELAKLYTETTK